MAGSRHKSVHTRARAWGAVRGWGRACGAGRRRGVRDRDRDESHGRVSLHGAEEYEATLAAGRDSHTLLMCELVLLEAMRFSRDFRERMKRTRRVERHLGA